MCAPRDFLQSVDKLLDHRYSAGGILSAAEECDFSLKFVNFTGSFALRVKRHGVLNAPPFWTLAQFMSNGSYSLTSKTTRRLLSSRERRIHCELPAMSRSYGERCLSQFRRRRQSDLGYCLAVPQLWRYYGHDDASKPLSARTRAEMSEDRCGGITESAGLGCQGGGRRCQ